MFILYGKVCLDICYLGRNPKSANSSKMTEGLYITRLFYNLVSYIFYISIYVMYFYRKKHPGKSAFESWSGFEKTLLGTTAKIYFIGTLIIEVTVYFLCVLPASERSIY